ncbi:hypothetical protein MCOR25_003367 [Pyricularia grisea]|nr:hypothetical protein MCOR25_003367 [Pyricularia grisea]
MPLDPVTAVGLGAGILQIIDFTTKLVDAGREITQSLNGATVEHCDIEAVTRSLVLLLRQVSDVQGGSGDQPWSVRIRSVGDRNMDNLTKGCGGVASELLEALNGLKITGKKTAWRSTLQALKTVWAENKIQSVRTRLAEYRMGIHTALLVSLRERVDDITPSLLLSLDNGTVIDQLKRDILKAIKEVQQGSGIDTSREVFKSLKARRRRDSMFSDTLVQNIAKKSSGVFLWVALVVRSLLNDLTNRDRMSDLERRLNELPDDLESFYQKIFDSIMNDGFYRQHACQLFRLVDVARGHLTVLGLSFADEDEDVSVKNALQSPISVLSPEVLDDRIEQARRQLNSCCKGLLEVPSFEYDESGNGSSVPWMRLVTYLHRTALDFLRSPQVDMRIRESAGEFNPSAPLLISSLMMIKTWSETRESTRKNLAEFGRLSLQYAEDLDDSGHPYQNALLDEVGRALYENGGSAIWEKVDGLTSEKPLLAKTFLELASQKHLSTFVSSKILSSNPIVVFLDQKDRPLLDRIVTQCKAYPSFRQPEFARDDPFLPAVPNLALVRHLLESGTNPNDEVKYDGSGRTIWENVLKGCVSAASTNRELMNPEFVKTDLIPRLEMWASVVKEFLKFGADTRMNRNSQQGSLIRQAFGELLSQRAKELEKMMSRKDKRLSLKERMENFITPLGKHVPSSLMDKIPLGILDKRARASMPTTYNVKALGRARHDRVKLPGRSVPITRDLGTGYLPFDGRAQILTVENQDRLKIGPGALSIPPDYVARTGERPGMPPTSAVTQDMGLSLSSLQLGQPNELIQGRVRDEVAADEFEGEYV